MKLFMDWYDYSNNRGDVYLCDAPIEDAERNHIASVIRDGTGNECDTARNIVEAVNNYATLRAELDSVKKENENMSKILLQINDPTDMMNGMSAALSWKVIYALKNPEARKDYGKEQDA